MDGAFVGAFVGALVGDFVGDLLGALVAVLVGALVGLGVSRGIRLWQKSHARGQLFLIFLPSEPSLPVTQYLAILFSFFFSFKIQGQPTIVPVASTVNL